MKVFAIGDLHLGHSVNKPMDIFGPQWQDHADRIARNWEARVGPHDLVLVPGDLSWAMRMEEAEEDIRWLDRLPGRKVILKGNHDYWWPSISRLRKRLQGTSLVALQYDSITIGGVSVAGTRMWTQPDLERRYRDPLSVVPGPDRPGSASPEQGASKALQDERIFQREMGRLKLSLESIDPGAFLRIVMTHFPPTDESGRETAVTRVLEQYGIHICVFGHLHNLGLPRGKTWDFVRNGVRYVLVSCDALDFAPHLLVDSPCPDHPSSH